MITRDASGLFYNIHRALTACWFLLCLAVLYYLYQKRQVFEPALDYYHVWKEAAPQPANLEQVSGIVFSVPSGNVFQFWTPDGRAFTCTLAGLEPPSPKQTTPRDIELKARSRDALRSMVLSNKVTLDVTYPQGLLALGIAHIGATNVNVELLRSGMARLHPEYIRALPVKEQFQMVRAEKIARQQKLGMWAVRNP